MVSNVNIQKDIHRSSGKIGRLSAHLISGRSCWTRFESHPSQTETAIAPFVKRSAVRNENHGSFGYDLRIVRKGTDRQDLS
jgi:hypothetical protein